MAAKEGAHRSETFLPQYPVAISLKDRPILTNGLRIACRPDRANRAAYLIAA